MGKRIIEVPCNHADTISQLEVHLQSKINELAHLRDHCKKLEKSNNAEVVVWTQKWEKAKEEVKKMQKQNLFSEAAVIA